MQALIWPVGRSLGASSNDQQRRLGYHGGKRATLAVLVGKRAGRRSRLHCHVVSCSIFGIERATHAVAMLTNKATSANSTIEPGMAGSLMHRKRGWRDWIIQFALLALLALHSVGLFHHHATAEEHDACVACQVADHQALDVPDVGIGPAVLLLVLLFLITPRHPRAPRCFRLFNRARSRAPPSSLNA